MESSNADLLPEKFQKFFVKSLVTEERRWEREAVKRRSERKRDAPVSPLPLTW